MKFRNFDLFEKYPLNIIPLSFYKFFITGIFVFIADNLVLLFFFRIVFHSSDEKIFTLLSISKIMGAITGLILGFIINRKWSFKKQYSISRQAQAIRYLFVFIINLVVAAIVFPIYLNITEDLFVTNLAVTFANMLTTATIMFISYSMYRFFVFK